MIARDYRAAARTTLGNNCWGMGVLITFLFLLLTTSPMFTYVWRVSRYLRVFVRSLMTMPASYLALAGLFVIGPVIAWAYSIAFLGALRGRRLVVNDLFIGFNNFSRIWCLKMLSAVYIALWSLLLVVPGIIKACAYAMAPYLMYDNPSFGAEEAITQSREMMQGHKWRFFCMNISFIGWFLLSGLTLGIGLLWLYPYIYTAQAHFYEDIKRSYAQRQVPPINQGFTGNGTADGPAATV